MLRVAVRTTIDTWPPAVKGTAGSVADAALQLSARVVGQTREETAMSCNALDEAVDLLRRTSETQQLVARAQSGFRAWIDEATDEDERDLPAGWSYSEMSAEFQSSTLCFQPALLSYPYVDTRLRIMRKGVEVGYYRFITRLDGEEDDDYFVIDAAAAPHRR